MNTQKQEQKNSVPNKPQSLPKPQEQNEIAKQAVIEALIANREQEKENKELALNLGKFALGLGGLLLILIGLPAVLSWLTRVLNSAKETQKAWHNFKQRA